MNSRPVLFALGLLLVILINAGLEGAERSIPEPLPGNPGNIYLPGQIVRIPPPESLSPDVTRWRLLDDRYHVIRQGRWPDSLDQQAASEALLLGQLPVGWYRIEFGTDDGPSLVWTSAAVLAPLEAPVPMDSPVCLDAAIAWFARDDVARQERFANLAALAGVNWVRDRMRWRELQPEPGPLRSAITTYDTAADIQHRHGLQILQVFHDSPPWTHESQPATGRFAPDLRHVYRFARGLARRYQGRVGGWEPWNEANVATFGGHTVDQMCSWQKAAWLGFKAGDPDVIVGWNATAAVPTPEQTHGVLANETWPYFDTYNIHTYDWSHSYADLWAPARLAASGRPLWITEADRGSPHLKNPPWYDLDPRLERLKAEWIAQSYASSLFAGATRHFHFILGHYHEPQGVQFGLLRLDLTPRPAYVALAAVGRCLANATVLGRWQPEPDVHVFAFHAQPDGQPHDILVIYAERDVDWDQRGMTTADWRLPESIEIRRIIDYLGRSIGTTFPAPLTSAPVFVFLAPGQAARLPITPPPPLAEWREGTASPVVLQLEMPRTAIEPVEDLPWSHGYTYSVAAGDTVRLPLHAYNFATATATGRVARIDFPSGWHIDWPEKNLEIDPGERVSLIGTLRIDPQTDTPDGWITIRADMGSYGRPVLAFRVRLKSQ